MIARWVLVPFVALCAAVGVAACGAEVSIGGSTLDEEELASELRSQLAAQAGVAPRSVECPSGIEPEAGKEFDCTGVAPDGTEFTIEVTLNDDEGGFDAFVPPGQFGPDPDQPTQ